MTAGAGGSWVRTAMARVRARLDAARKMSAATRAGAGVGLLQALELADDLDAGQRLLGAPVTEVHEGEGAEPAPARFANGA